MTCKDGPPSGEFFRKCLSASRRPARKKASRAKEVFATCFLQYALFCVLLRKLRLRRTITRTISGYVSGRVGRLTPPVVRLLESSMRPAYTLEELEVLLGEHLRNLRLNRNIDQKTLSARAGISCRALQNLEAGAGSTIKTLIFLPISICLSATPFEIIPSGIRCWTPVPAAGRCR